MRARFALAQTLHPVAASNLRTGGSLRTGDLVQRVKTTMMQDHPAGIAAALSVDSTFETREIRDGFGEQALTELRAAERRCARMLDDARRAYRTRQDDQTQARLKRESDEYKGLEVRRSFLALRPVIRLV